MADNDQDLVGMTEEELKAIAEADDDDDIVDIDAGNGGAPIEGDAKTKEASAEDKAKEGGEELPKEEEDKEDEADLTAKDPIPFIPKYSAESIDNLAEANTKLDESYAKLSDDLAAKYENADMTFSEYRKEMRELDARYLSEQKKIDTARLKYELAQEQAAQTAEQKWEWEQELFFRDNPSFKEDPILFGALSGTLQAMYADKSNAAKTGLQLLREASNKVNAKFNIVETNKQVLSDKKPEKPVLKPDTKPLPKTLANVPAADTNVMQAGEFDHLDSLQGLALEAAIAKLSDEQQARYLS